MFVASKQPFDFEDVYRLERFEKELESDSTPVLGAGGRKNRPLVLAVLGASLSFAAPVYPVPTLTVASMRNSIACVADATRQAEQETTVSPGFEFINSCVGKPGWLPFLGEHPEQSLDLDVDAYYVPAPVREYSVYLQAVSIEKAEPPTYIGWEDDVLEDVFYQV